MISSVSSESLHYCTQINHHWLWALKPHASVLLHSWAITVSRPFPITTQLQFLARVIVIVHDKLHRLHPIVHKASESVWFNPCSETECDRTNIQPKMHFWFKSSCRLHEVGMWETLQVLCWLHQINRRSKEHRLKISSSSLQNESLQNDGQAHC